MPKNRLMKYGTALALAASFALSLSAAAAASFRPGVGIADPAMGINATGYIKWGQSTAVPFIDRMKGAFAWSGQLPSGGGQTSGSVVALTDPGVFAGGGPVPDVTLGKDTVVDLNRLIVAAVFRHKLISREQNQAIQRSPEAFFRIEDGPNGNSQLEGRLRESDPFRPLVRFDRDIGMDLDEMRNAGHLKLTREDRRVPISELTLDANGWPMRMPTDLAGRTGSVSTSLLWYPAKTALVPGGIYGGTFYLLADGQGTLSLVQRGKGENLLALNALRVDGPTALKFGFTPNGQRVDLTISETDPDGNGEYLRNIRIVHETHLPLFEAGEIFTPEYLDFMEDFRVIRWMNAMEGHRNPPFFAGGFEDRTKLSYYSFNLGTSGTERNGIPIDAIIAFSNKTGTDPWITVPVNVSDRFARGMADYIAANLDPALTLYVELGNENWNGIFPSYQYAARAALDRWGELAVRIGPDGRPAVARPGRFVSNETVKLSGASSRADLAKKLGLDYELRQAYQGWAEWSAMRATQVGRIFEQAFADADPTGGARRVHNVMGTFSVWPGASDLLMQAALWREMEPDAWIDPRSVFESLAAGAYFGGYMGSRHSDMVSEWIADLGQEGAKRMALRHLTAGLDPAKPYYRLDPAMLRPGGRDAGRAVIRGVRYTPDLIIDAWPLLQRLHPSLRQRMRKGAGVKAGKALLGPEEAAQYLRLAEEGGDTVLQVKTGGDRFATVLAFDGIVSRSLEQMIAEGIVLPRSLNNMAVEAAKYFGGQQDRAKTYGVDLVAYEGGQHMAAAIWGPFRANLKNEPLIGLLREMNRAPEIAGLYHLWLDAWREAGGGLFAHFADIGMPGRYGNWGLMSYLGHGRKADAALPKWEAVKQENARGAWWREQRQPAAFLHGVVSASASPDAALVGTAKHDVLVALAAGMRLAGGPGNDALYAGAGRAALAGGEGDDVMVVSSADVRVDGSGGRDVLKAAMGMGSLDLSAIEAAGIEAVDLRNAARTAFRAAPADVIRVTGGEQLTVYAETADRLTLAGFEKVAAAPADGGYQTLYAGGHGGRTVSLTLVTDIAPR